MSFRQIAIVITCFIVSAFSFNVEAAAQKQKKAVHKTDAETVKVVLDRRGNPVLGSAAAAVVHQTSGAPVFSKNGSTQVSIASITKLMTAMVVLDAKQNLSEKLKVTDADVDTLKGSSSRVAVGTVLTREQMLQLALMSSENRAASALARYYPGGRKGFVKAMNIKARMLGLKDTNFVDSTGLNPDNLSTPDELAKLVAAAATYPLIRDYSTTSERHVRIGKNTLRFANTNALVRDPEWQVGLSKTGFIREAGRCLVMQLWIRNEPVIVVLMNASGNFARTVDAKRVKQWLETSNWPRVASTQMAAGG